MTLCLSACATSPRAQESRANALPAHAVPEDFWISVTVMNPVDDPQAPRAARPARYLIEADHALRVLTGPGVSEYTHPPLLRQLSESQTGAVYRAFHQAQLAGQGGEVSTAPHAPASSALIVISAREHRTRKTIVIDTVANPELAAKAQPLVETLAQMAWLESR